LSLNARPPQSVLIRFGGYLNIIRDYCLVHNRNMYSERCVYRTYVPTMMNTNCTRVDCWRNDVTHNGPVQYYDIIIIINYLLLLLLWSLWIYDYITLHIMCSTAFVVSSSKTTRVTAYTRGFLRPRLPPRQRSSSVLRPRTNHAVQSIKYDFHFYFLPLERRYNII
jgi:hypothetical protein